MVLTSLSPPLTCSTSHQVFSSPGASPTWSSVQMVPQSPGLVLLMLVSANYRPSRCLWLPPVPFRTLQIRVVGPVAAPLRAKLHPDPHPPDTHPGVAGPPGAPAARQRAVTLQQHRRSSKSRTHPSSARSTFSPSTSESTLLLLSLVTRYTNILH